MTPSPTDTVLGKSSMFSKFNKSTSHQQQHHHHNQQHHQHIGLQQHSGTIDYYEVDCEHQHNVLYVPELCANSLSVSAMALKIQME